MVIYLVLQITSAREAMQELIDANTKLIAEVQMSAHVAHACLLLVSCFQKKPCLHFEQSKYSSADRYNHPKALDIAPLMHWSCNHQTLQRLPKHTVSGMQRQAALETVQGFAIDNKHIKLPAQLAAIVPVSNVQTKHCGTCVCFVQVSQNADMADVIAEYSARIQSYAKQVARLLDAA